MSRHTMRDFAPLTLDELQRELIHEEALRLAVGDDPQAPGFAQLAEAALTGLLPASLNALTERLLQLLLATGALDAEPARARAARQLWRATPAGRREADQARALSEALRPLAGQPLEGLVISSLGPGAYALELTTGAGSVRLELGPGGQTPDGAAEPGALLRRLEVAALA